MRAACCAILKAACIPKTKTEALVPNPHFLSADLLYRFLECLEPMRSKLGPLMLQFGYLNQNMIESQADFLDRLEAFMSWLPKELEWCIEPRNPAWLNGAYFTLLRRLGAGHVFQQGYYMPPVWRVFGQYADKLPDQVVVRLHGPDRERMDERAGKDWSKIVEARDGEIAALAGLLQDLRNHGRKTWLFVNNHYEGCAPLTIKRLREQL